MGKALKKVDVLRILKAFKRRLNTEAAHQCVIEAMTLVNEAGNWERAGERLEEMGVPIWR